MRRIILKTTQSPGDVVMLTAAVRTPCPALWENNPHLTPLADGAGEWIGCHYPLIHGSNTGSWHFTRKGAFSC